MSGAVLLLLHGVHRDSSTFRTFTAAHSKQDHHHFCLKEGKKGDGRTVRRIKLHVKVNNDRKLEKRH
jgi:hypothetical protein